MRKALFAVMLIGASFAGGAVVNGPGLRWAQEMILSHLNGDGDEDGDSEAKSKPDESEPPAQLLSAPLSLDEALAAGKADSPNGKTEPEAASQDGQTQPRPAGSESGPAEAKIAAAAAAALAAGRNEAASAPAAAPPAAKSEGSVAAGALKMLGNAFGRKEEPPADDREIALAKVPTPLPEGTVPPPLEPLDPLPLPNEAGDAASRPAAKVDDPPAKDRDKRLALAAAPIAAAAAAAATAAGSPPPRTLEPIPAPVKGAVGAGADANSTPRPASSWTEIRSRMAKLGVSRYGVEGEPNGRVRFHCVIPLAGRRAVAQQFEAEGDDELQAAEIALRRVALWRATENPGP